MDLLGEKAAMRMQPGTIGANSVTYKPAIYKLEGKSNGA